MVASALRSASLLTWLLVPCEVRPICCRFQCLQGARSACRFILLGRSVTRRGTGSHGGALDHTEGHWITRRGTGRTTDPRVSELHAVRGHPSRGKSWPNLCPRLCRSSTQRSTARTCSSTGRLHMIAPIQSSQTSEPRRLRNYRERRRERERERERESVCVKQGQVGT
jgi:hypothetical protein